MTTARRPRTLPPEPTTGRCLECGKDLAPIPRRTRYCSDDCGLSYWARRNYNILVARVKKRDGHTCQICGFNGRHVSKPTFSSPDDNWLEVDHIKPIADGGAPLDPDNCRTLCRHCHRKVTAEWRREKALERVQGWAMPVRGKAAELLAGQQELPL